MRKQIFQKLLLAIFGLLALGLFMAPAKSAQAANPTTMNFQGKLVNSDGTNIADGTYSVVFRIYNTASPTMTTSCTSTASCLWQETQASVSVTNSIFQVELGSACALTSSSCSNSAGGPINFATSSALYLTMQFDGDTSGSNGGFMSPLIHITSVPFALQADNSSTLGGLAATNFVQLAQGLQTDSSTTNASIAVNKTNASGTPDILLLQKSGQNVLEVNNSGTVLLGQAGASGLNGTLTFNNGSGSNTVSLSLQADPGSSYTLLLPTTGPSTSQCLQTDGTTANQLVFSSCAAGGSGYATIQDEGSGLTTRTTLNFIGNAVSCADNSGSTRTDCTIKPTAQNVYDNSTGSTIPEIILNNGGVDTGGFDIQNNNSSPITGSLFSINDKASSGLGTSMFTVADTGFISIQPAASLTSGQSHISQSFTNGSSTGGTVQGYSQTITVSNTSSASTTNGINIAINDATSLANIDVGIKVDTSGVTNNSATNLAAKFNAGSVLQTAASPIYRNGNDSSSGAGSDKILSVFTANKYEYIGKVGNSGTCSNSVSTGCEFQIYDISNPSSPSYVGGAEGNNSSGGTVDVNSVYVVGNYAYLATNSDGTATACSTGVHCEFLIYDISNPSSPTLVGSADSNSAGTGTHNFTKIYISGRYAYIAESASSDISCPDGCEFRIYDISNHSKPTVVGSVDPSNLGVTNTPTIDSVAVSGSYAYIALKTDSTPTACNAGTGIHCELTIYNISNPASPTFIDGIDVTSAGTGVNDYTSVVVSGRYMFVSSLSSSATCSASIMDGCEIKVFDISNPSTPLYLGGADAGHNVNAIYLNGNYLYAAASGNTGTCNNTVSTGCELQVYDISNPSTPIFIGGADNGGSTVSEQNSAISVVGRYAYIGKVGNSGTCSGTVRTGCENQVYDISGIEATSITGSSIYAGSLQVQNSAYFSDNITAASGLNVGQSLQVAGPISSSSSLIIASTGNTGTATINLGSTSSNLTLTLPSALPGSSNSCIIGTSTGILSFSACGAGATATVTLTPEYAGAVMTGDGSNNTGTMTSDFCSGSGVGGLNINASVCGTGTATHNYYSWTANATNDYDIWVRWQAPSDFASFGSNAFTLNGWTTSTSDSAALTVYNASNTSCGTGTVSTTAVWGTAQITPSGCSVSAGQVMTLKIHVNVGVTSEFARAGEITIVYNRN